MSPAESKYQPSNEEHDRIDNAFVYHPPLADQAERYGKLRAQAHGLAQAALCHCPPSAERTIAMRKLEEFVMWANASIARNEKQQTK